MLTLNATAVSIIAHNSLKQKWDSPKYRKLQDAMMVRYITMFLATLNEDKHYKFEYHNDIENVLFDKSIDAYVEAVIGTKTAWHFVALH